MDKKFEAWKQQNEAFCKKAGISEVQMLYVLENAIASILNFRCKIQCLSRDYSEADINIVINNLSTLRTFIRELKG